MLTHQLSIITYLDAFLSKGNVHIFQIKMTKLRLHVAFLELGIYQCRPGGDLGGNTEPLQVRHRTKGWKKRGTIIGK